MSIRHSEQLILHRSDRNICQLNTHTDKRMTGGEITIFVLSGDNANNDQV